MKRLASLLAAALIAPSLANAGDPQSCTVPGVEVMTDAAGDEQGAPATSFGDLLSLSLAEPASNDGVDKLVFTLKVSDLATIPPNGLWSIRFGTDVPPPNGDDLYFVAMVAGPDATPHFIYGSEILEEGEAPRLWTPAGDLDPSSNYNADGTITLVLDKSKVPGLTPGGDVFIDATQFSLDHSPTDGTLPYTTGLVALLIDAGDAADGYVIAGNDACSGDKSGVLGLGAMPLPVLLILGAAAFRRRAR